MNTTTTLTRHPPTMPLTLHEREFAAQLLARGWSIATTARALQCHRETAHCCRG